MKSILHTIAGGLLALALTFGAVETQATTALQLTREQLVKTSDLVVRATPVAAESRWNDDHSQIHTFTRLQVRGFIKGSGPVEIEIDQLGGTVDGMTMSVSGDARLVPGEEMILFLRSDGQGKAQVNGMAQGAYRVLGDKVQRDLSGLQLMRQIGGKLRALPHRPDPREPLAKLLADVVRIARGR